jgi:hypothetical protein
MEYDAGVTNMLFLIALLPPKSASLATIEGPYYAVRTKTMIIYPKSSLIKLLENQKKKEYIILI